MSQVKGLAFRSVLRAVAELKGQSVVDQACARLGTELGQSLRYVAASSWYPVEQYVALWDAVQLVTDNQSDFPRVVGRKCVEQDLKLVHKLACAALSVPTVLGITARLFPTYYDTGQCTSMTLAPGTVRIEIDGCVGFNSAIWTELRGASECFAERAGRLPNPASSVEVGQEIPRWSHWFNGARDSALPIPADCWVNSADTRALVPACLLVANSTLTFRRMGPNAFHMSAPARESVPPIASLMRGST